MTDRYPPTNSQTRYPLCHAVSPNLLMNLNTEGYEVYSMLCK